MMDLIVKRAESSRILCQCCFSHSNSASLVDMFSPIEWDGTLQDYADLLDYCFNVRVPKPENEPTTLYICCMCIARLKESCVFKNQVEESQSRITLAVVNITSMPNSPFSDYYGTEENVDLQNNGDLFLTSEYPYAEDIKVDLTGRKMKKERHKKIKSHRPKVYNCNICGEDFDCKQSLSTHRKEHGTESMCQVCGKMFKRIELLQHHMLVHTAKVQCDICHKYLARTGFQRHKLIHKGFLPYACKICPKRFNSDYRRRFHRTKEHGVPMREFPCTQCTMVFPSAGQRSSHYRNIHLLERNYVCKVCEKGFFTALQLENHIVVHTGEKFECDICHKSYSKKAYLKKHLKVQHNVEKYKCHVCDRSFTQNRTLMSHIKTHEKPNSS